MKELKSIIHRILGNYEIYWIYGNPVTSIKLSLPENVKISNISEKEVFEKSADIAIKDLSQYCGDGSIGFGIWIGDRIASSCWFWHGERYKKRNFWPLNDKEAKMVAITTAKYFRNKSLATFLITYATEEMKNFGFDRLYARIWFSNRSSIAAFSRSGWNRIAIVSKVFPCYLPFFIKIIINFQEAPFFWVGVGRKKESK